MYVRDNEHRFPNLDLWVESTAPYVQSQNVFCCPGVSIHNQYHPGVDYGVYPRRVTRLKIDKRGHFFHNGAAEQETPLITQQLLSGQKLDLKPNAMGRVNQGIKAGDMAHIWCY